MDPENIAAAGARLVASGGDALAGERTARRYALASSKGSPERTFWRAVAESIRDAHGMP